jgi:modification methylase smaI
MQADRVISGDCRLVLPRLIAAGVRVQTCITSPPYYGLRDYGLPGQIGLEQTMQDYLAALLQVFRLVRELLPTTAPFGSTLATATLPVAHAAAICRRKT